MEVKPTSILSEYHIQTLDNMNAVKYNKGGKLKVSTATKSVPAPTGFHWMEERGRYFLMKGDYKPHPGAVKEAKFKLVNHA